MFTAIDANLARQVGQKLEMLAKSFAAGYQGIQNAGRTGVSALANDHIDPILKSITLEEKDFLLTKDIPTINVNQSVYSYKVKTAIGAGIDLAGFESFLPQESTAQYMRVAEVLKVYGLRKSITQMAQLINDADGYSEDLEKENDINAALAMAEAMERDLYIGGDYFLDASGSIDATIASNPNGPIRQVRGIQANIREGNVSLRGIPGDFVGYGNNRSVVFDRKGGVMERGFLDEIVTAVRDSRGAIKEAHCTTSQLKEFRATFFPIERANLGETYAIRGAAINNDEHVRVPIETVGGNIDFIPTVFKYLRVKPVIIAGSVGNPPAAPSVAVANGSSATSSGFKAGEVYRYLVQSVNIHGTSSPAATSPATITVANDDYPIELTITNVAAAEYYKVFRTPVEANGTAGKEFFVGNIVPASGASTIFRDNGKIIPGLDGVLFLPRDKNRAKLAKLGNLLNKLELGNKGTAFEHIYTSYFGVICERPRSFAIADNVFQKREGL